MQIVPRLAKISIHVPTKGTTSFVLLAHTLIYFNPRTHEGYDLITLFLKLYPPVFQSTYPRRVRRLPVYLETMAIQFQSTYPRRVRPKNSRLERCCIHFNPRTHEGYDCVTKCFCHILTISIHVPTKGTTVHDHKVYRFTFNFNPRTHEGYDCNCNNKLMALIYFNPRTHEGYDNSYRTSNKSCRISIHVPTKGTT